MMRTVGIFASTVLFICVMFINQLTANQQEINLPAEIKTADALNPKEYKAELLRDPFQSYPEEGLSAFKQEGEIPQAGMPQESLPSLNVQGVIWGGSLPQAIINNKVVKIGDTQEGARIVDISKNGVTVFFNGRKYILSSWPRAKTDANLKGF